MKTTKVLIDCSSTTQCPFNSGIQRVVRSLCQVATKSSGDVTFIPVVGRDGKWYPVQSLWPEKDWNSYVANSPLAVWYRRVMEPVVTASKSKKLRKLFLPAPGHAGVFKIPRKLLKSVEKRWKRSRDRVLPVEIDQQTTLLLADATWMEPNWDAVLYAQSQGAFVGNLIYDLIPVTHPQFMPPELVNRFGSWLERTLTLSEFYLCISNAVRDDVKEHLSQRGFSQARLNQCVQSFPLGGDFQKSSFGVQPSSTVRSLFQSNRERNPFLIVSTIEPRKNHAFVLNAFERLWADGSNEKLCLVGRIGWNCQAFQERVETHPEYGLKLFMINDARDVDVEWAYRNAKGVIMASVTEGYGLPIVEGLEFGNRVLASDTPIHREVGADCVDYFSISDDGRELVERIQAVGKNASKSVCKPIQIHTPWKTSFAELKSRLVEFSRSRTSAPDESHRRLAA